MNDTDTDTPMRIPVVLDELDITAMAVGYMAIHDSLAARGYADEAENVFLRLVPLLCQGDRELTSEAIANVLAMVYRREAIGPFG